MNTPYAQAQVEQEPPKSGPVKRILGTINDHLEKKEINRKLIDVFNSYKIGLDVDVFDIDITDGLSLKGNYDYEIEKSYIQGQYTRRPTGCRNS